jgi:plasmid maintenance system antidote protein VapI
MYANDLIPGDIFHPGEIIKDEMEAQSMKQSDLVREACERKTKI